MQLHLMANTSNSSRECFIYTMLKNFMLRYEKMVRFGCNEKK